MTKIIHLWNLILAEGAHFGVNPTVFAILYLAHHPLFWGTVGWIVVRVKNRQIIWPHCIVAAAFWLTPWVYIALSAKHLPWYVEALAVVALLFGIYHAVQEVRKKISSIHQSTDMPLINPVRNKPEPAD